MTQTIPALRKTEWKRGKSIRPVVLLCLFLCHSFLLQAQSASGYVIKNSISNQHINTISEDKAGYVWIGTAKGLCRYNGYEYYHYYHSPEAGNSLPSDFITAVYLDSRRQLWVATNKGACRYNYETDDFSPLGYGELDVKHYFEYGFTEYQDVLYVYGSNGLKRIDRESLALAIYQPTADMILQTVVQDDYNQIWFADRTTSKIFFTNPDFNRLESIPIDPSLEVNCSYNVKQGEIWLGTNRGILRVDPLRKVIRDEPSSPGEKSAFSKLSITFFHPLDERRLFIGTENRGLFLYDTETGLLEAAADTEYFPNIRSLHMTCCYQDKEKNTWLGTFDQGYYRENFSTRRFNNDRVLNAFFQGKFVTRIEEDKELNLWLGTRYHGLIHYNVSTGRITEYNDSNFAPFIEANSNFIQSLYLDSEGNLWIGYNRYLLWCRVEDNRILDYRIFPVNSDIVTIMEDDFKRVWTGSSMDGIRIYDVRRPEHFQILPLAERWNNITKIIRLRSGEMLFPIYEQGMYIADPNTLTVRSFDFPEQVKPWIAHSIFLFEDRESGLWVGTYGHGIVYYNRLTGVCKTYTPQTGLPSNDILSMIDDFQGNLWISTSYGISKFDPRENSFTNYFETDGTGGNQFHEKAILRSRNGKIYFGGNHGITGFNPPDIRLDTRTIPVVLEDLKISNRSVAVGGEPAILSRHISETDSIVLNHKQTVFSIDFAGIDFKRAGKIRYAYRLRDFERDWNYVENFRRATYSNIPPGNYLFEVKAQNPDGIWNEIPTRLSIRIKPAPWFTVWAVAAYIALILLILYICLRVYIRMQIDKQKIVLIEKERQSEQEMNELKIRFFNNVSHEFRTPLSMICGPVKKLKSKECDPETEEYLLQLLDYNAENLLRQINKLLDLEKLESDTLSLCVSEQDAVKMVKEQIQGYSFYAREKNIPVELQAEAEEIRGWFDADKFNMITGNLLSNALKYTPKEGHVTIRMKVTSRPGPSFRLGKTSGDYLFVQVVDDGIGIEQQDLQNLFQRYRRFGVHEKDPAGIPGKGIGLHYVKQLVTKHKGGILAERGEGKGMVFSFVLPIDRSAYDETELSGRLPAEFIPEGIVADGAPVSTGPDAGSGDKEYTILIAEDHTELRVFLERLFSRRYNVLAASNGEEAYGIAAAEPVDLIISDILMPGMDGFELCGKVKQDPELCHIPLILLTAKNMESDQIAGYSQGADAYVTKPFNPVLLETMVENLLSNLRRRQTKLLGDHLAVEEKQAAGEEKEEPETVVLNPLDRRFLDKLYACLDRELSNTELNVNALGKELAFSRTSFYRKIKALTGQSPNDFLRVYRLKKAAELILRNEFSINEIVDMTGFSSHSHFSYCFKKQFGVNPKDYHKKN